LQAIALGLNIVGWIVFAAAATAAFLLALRVVLAWLGANPFGWLPYNLTRLSEPIVRPLRYPFSVRGGRFDLVPLVAAILVLMNGLFIMGLLGQLARILVFLGGDLISGNPSAAVVVSESIRLIGWVLVAAIFLRFVLPYVGVPYGSRIMRLVFKTTEPVLAPLRKPLRRFVGATPFDFTALIGVFIVWLAAEFLASVAWQVLT
jgi:uncharacterized protein YggT (Ycf19 family)